jgi:hypothetical protein
LASARPSPPPSPPGTGERGNGARPGNGAAPARRRQTVAELRELQRLALKAIIRPLAPGYATQRTWEDGRPTGEVVSTFIKPNDRLTAFERVQIYNKQYWFRLLDCLYDDYPGLRAVLGDRRFEELRIAYLNKYPSKSFSLRNLGSRLERFLTEEPQWTAPHGAMALGMARFEWAQVVAFDGEARPALAVDDLLGRDPAKLTLGVQPYVTLLEMGYPLDDFVLALKKRDALRSEASNAVETDEAEREPRRRAPAVRRPGPQKVFLAVHRYENALYYKRLEPEAYTILCALRDGKTLARACALAVERSGRPGGEWVGQIKEWFESWTRMGWFCHRRR